MPRTGKNLPERPAPSGFNAEATEASETIKTDAPVGASSVIQGAASSDEKTTVDVHEDEEQLPDPAKYIEAHILSKLDPAFVDYFLRVMLKNAPAQDVTIADVREHPEKFRSALAMDTSGEPRVADHQVTSEDGTNITVRVYHPDPEEHGPGPYPVHLNFHGK